ncbi:MAG TPA: cytochrome c biogenesis protein CcsA [Candidatus Limnocylindrales bacterium]|nr:cytochrome c biogenesis protein CcsA [Candidatus Limnocylindrales bacterium]
MTQIAQISQLLFPIATVLVGLGFAAYVGHAVMLANGRRSLSVTVPTTAREPAWAAVVTGSFAQERAAAATIGPDLAGSPTPLGRAAEWLTWAGFAVLIASLALRGVVVGRGPWGNMFEFSVAFSTAMIGGYLILGRRYPIRSIGFIPVGVALVILLYAASLGSGIRELVPALQNAPLLTIHVGMAVISYGTFATSFAAGVAYLAQGRDDRFRWLPSHKVLDEVAYRSVIFGFPIFATMIVLGSWWASIAWSRYWGWDPKETAALVTWLTYAVYLHARNQRAWSGRPAALLLVVAFGMVIVTYSGSLWFSGLHSYSGL